MEIKGNLALRTRADHYGVEIGVDSRRLASASHLLAAVTGNFVPRNKAIVGENAFAHEAGIHQHGMLASRETYEIMKPEQIIRDTHDLPPRLTPNELIRI